MSTTEMTPNLSRAVRSRRRALGALAVSATLVLAACGGSSGPKTSSGTTKTTSGASGASPTSGAASTKPPPSNGVLTLAANAEADSLDPQYGAGGQDYQYLYPLYDTLIDL